MLVRMHAPGILAVILFGFIPQSFSQKQPELAQRSPYSIPLAKLSVSFEENTSVCEKVKVYYEGSEDYQVITAVNDYSMKVHRRGTEKTIYREHIARAFMLTDFEAEVLGDVVKTFISTLETFEKNLQKQRWGRCLYLDGYFPRFLEGFYYLYTSARNSSEALPEISLVPDSLYEVSLASVKSDKRINAWKSDKEQIIRLRIITKELIFQLKRLQKKELANRKRNPEISYGGEFEEVFALFIRNYFGLKSLKK
ncbi:MAG: hypothetical protein GF401_06250 [Chitinivibrionales bacterium]|nr:hypothetical protein [Chitinivibrionales bacterium]